MILPQAMRWFFPANVKKIAPERPPLLTWLHAFIYPLKIRQDGKESN